MLQRKKFQDSLDGKVHQQGIPEPVVGTFDGDEFDKLVVREAVGILIRYDLVGGAVEDQQVFGIVQKILFPQVKAAQFLQRAKTGTTATAVVPVITV